MYWQQERQSCFGDDYDDDCLDNDCSKCNSSRLEQDSLKMFGYSNENDRAHNDWNSFDCDDDSDDEYDDDLNDKQPSSINHFLYLT